MKAIVNEPVPAARKSGRNGEGKRVALSKPETDKSGQDSELERLINYLPAPFLIIGAASYRVKIANSAASGNRPTEGITCHELLHNCEKPCFLVGHRCSLEEAKITGKPVFVEQTRYYDHGQKRVMVVHAFPVLNEQGEVIEAIEVYMDITERRMSQDALRESEENFRHLFEDSRDAILIRRQDGRILNANRATQELFGYTREELIGADNGMLYADPGEREVFERNIAKEGTLKDYDVRFSRKDGVGIDALVSSSYRLDANGSKIYQTIIHDITWRKHQERELEQTLIALRRSNTDLEQFAYVASHDLQEPLRMISGYTQLLAKRYGDKLDEAANEFIGYAVDGADRMRNLIDDLLTYSRVATRGKEFTSTDLGEVLEQTLLNLKLSIEENDARITHDALPTVNADGRQMVQLLQNLIANAIKFRGKASPRVHIGVERADTKWIFSVKDNGIGIEPQYMKQIFKVFERLHTREEYPGTGIGLSVCKKIVERHGGKIWVEPATESGSIFYFTIPAKRE